MGNDKSGSLKFFFESQNCLKLLNLLLEDIDNIKQQCTVYMHDISPNSPAIV
jgi:hypothetical protein